MNTNWKDIDWNLCNADIAKITGKTRQRVSQVRIELKAPRSPNHNRKIDHQAKEANYVAMIQQCETPMDLAQKMGKDLEDVRHIWRKYCYAAGRPQWRESAQYLERQRKRHKYPWHLMNPDLPNADISRIWGIREPASQFSGFMIARKRCRSDNPLVPLAGTKPKWDLRRVATHSDQEYLKAVEIEKGKALEFYTDKASGMT